MSKLKDYILGLFFMIWVSFFISRMPLPLQQGEVFLAVNGSVAVFALWRVVRKVKRGQSWHWHPIISLIGVFVLMRLLWLVIAPMPKYGSLDRVIANAIVFSIFIFFVTHFNDWRKARSWENALISIAIVFAGFELLLVFISLRNWWVASELLYSWPPIGIRIYGGLLGHPNLMSGFLNLIIPLVLVRLIVGKRTSWKFIWGLVLVLFLVIQFFTSSRGGWLSGVAGIFVTLGLLYFPQIFDGDLIRRLKSLYSPQRVAAIIVAGLVVMFGFVGLFNQASATPGHGGRLDIWTFATEIWSQNWLVGRGTGSFQLYFAQLIQSPPGFSAERAHSFIFQVGSEHGIIGLVLVSIIIIVAVQSWFRAWRFSEGSNRDVLSAYAGIGAAAVIHNTGDLILGSMIYSVGLLLILAMVVIRDPVYQKSRISNRKAVFVFSTLIAVSVIGTFVTLPGIRQYNLGISQAREDDWNLAAKNICDVADSQVSFSLYQFECGLAIAQSSSYESDNYLGLDAVEYYLIGLNVDPYWPTHWANLGVLQWQSGDKSNAIKSMNTAVAAAPRSALYALQLGWMAEQVGNESLAKDAYLQALNLDPWLIVSSYFNKNDLRINVRNQINKIESVATVEKMAVNGYIQYQSGDFASARYTVAEAIRLDPLNARAHAILGLILEQMDKHNDAWQEIQTALLIEKSAKILGWAAYVAENQGREDLRISYLSDAYAKLVNDASYSDKYYAGIYHRFVLSMDHVPGYQRGDLLPELVDGLYWLSDYYESEGEFRQSEKLYRWLDAAGLILEVN